jgi:hypothetical protein
MALVGCTEAEIASITGHSLRDVRSILDAHYLHRDPELARAAIHKLEMGYAKRAQETRTGTNSSKMVWLFYQGKAKSAVISLVGAQGQQHYRYINDLRLRWDSF